MYGIFYNKFRVLREVNRVNKTIDISWVKNLKYRDINGCSKGWWVLNPQMPYLHSNPPGQLPPRLADVTMRPRTKARVAPCLCSHCAHSSRTARPIQEETIHDPAQGPVGTGQSSQHMWGGNDHNVQMLFHSSSPIRSLQQSCKLSRNCQFHFTNKKKKSLKNGIALPKVIWLGSGWNTNEVWSSMYHFIAFFQWSHLYRMLRLLGLGSLRSK